MKKLLFAALAATTLFAACNKGGDNTTAPSDDLTTVTLKIDQMATRAIADAGETGHLKLTGGLIYIFDTEGKLLVPAVEAGDPAVANPQELELTGNNSAIGFNGQTLAGKYPASARIYIIGNFPDEYNGAAPDLKGNLSSVASLSNDDPGLTVKLKGIQGEFDTDNDGTPETDYYKIAAMANSNGQPASVQITGTGKGRVDVSLKPLMSRIELHKLLTKPYTNSDNHEVTIKGFKVTGVYVDSYDNAFTFTGAPAGDRRELRQATDDPNGVYADIAADKLSNKEGATSIFESSSSICTAVAATGKVWAYQVSACKLPRFIIGISDVTYEINNAGSITTGAINDQKYITVSGYNGINEFERGKIYRVGGTDGITFTLDDLYDTPNPENVDLTVYVTVEDWVLVDAEPYL